QKQKAGQEPRLAGLFEPTAQSLQTTGDVAAPGRHQADETAGPDMPQTDRVALGMVEQHRAVALGGVEIARPEGDRACPLAQDAAEGQRLADGVAFLDVALDHAERLFGKSLQPQDASLE